MDVELVFAGWRPGESCCVQQSRVSRTAIGQHERSVEENDTLGIANRSRKWAKAPKERRRSEEHTSELQSQSNLVCRLLLEKKKKKKSNDNIQLNTAVYTRRS